MSWKHSTLNWSVLERTDVTADVTQPMMQALALLPEKIRQRRRVRQRILDPGSPRAAFANPKYGSTSRNFIFRVMATRKISPAPIPATPPYQEMQEGEKRSIVVVARSTYSAKHPSGRKRLTGLSVLTIKLIGNTESSASGSLVENQECTTKRLENI